MKSKSVFDLDISLFVIVKCQNQHQQTRVGKSVLASEWRCWLGPIQDACALCGTRSAPSCLKNAETKSKAPWKKTTSLALSKCCIRPQYCLIHFEYKLIYTIISGRRFDKTCLFYICEKTVIVLFLCINT